MFSAIAKSFLCVEWSCQLYSEVAWNLRNMLHMHKILIKCVETILRAKTQASPRFQKSIFFDIWNEPRVNFRCQKKLFWNLREACVLARIIFSTHFIRMLCICKMFLRVQEISRYNSHDNLTRRNYFAIAEMSQESISDEMLIKIFGKIGDRGGSASATWGNFAQNFIK